MIAASVPLTTAPGLRSQTLLASSLEPTSSAFLRTAGAERLYSGVTNRTGVGGLDALAKRGPFRGRTISVEVLIVKWQLPDLDRA